jgi:Putative zinc-finger
MVGDGGHLDEGEIHAWLDGALPAAEGARVAAHLEGCAECAAAVAEARGFIAAASRILTALDEVPGGVVPASGARGRRAWWRGGGWPVRVAAGIVVAAIGTLAIVRRVDVGTAARVAVPDTVSARAAPPPPVTAPPAPVVAPPAPVVAAPAPVVAAPAAAAGARFPVAGPAKARAATAESDFAGKGAPAPTLTAPAAAPAPAAQMAPMAQMRVMGKVAGRASGVGAVAKKEAVSRVTGCYDVVHPTGLATEMGLAFPSRLVLDSAPTTADGNPVRVLSADSAQYAGSTWRAVTADSIEVDVAQPGAPLTVRTSVDADGLHGLIRANASSATVPFAAARCAP